MIDKKLYMPSGTLPPLDPWTPPKKGEPGYTGFLSEMKHGVLDKDRHITILDPGTGSGKSYSSRMLIRDFLHNNPDQFRYVIYLTPLRNSLMEQFAGLLREDPALRCFTIYATTMVEGWEDPPAADVPLLKKKYNSYSEEILSAIEKSKLKPENDKEWGKIKDALRSVDELRIAKGKIQDDAPKQFYNETFASAAGKANYITIKRLEKYEKNMLISDAEEFNRLYEHFVAAEGADGEPDESNPQEVSKYKVQHQLARYKALVSLMAKNPELVKILSILTNSLLLSKKCVFMTTSKSLYDLTTYISAPRQALLHSEALLRDSLVILDESDAQYSFLLKGICEEAARRSFNLLSVVHKLEVGFRERLTKKFPKSYKGSEKIIRKTLEKAKEYVPDSFHLGESCQIANVSSNEDQTSGWMCIQKKDEIIAKGDTRWIFKYAEEEGVVYIIPCNKEGKKFEAEHHLLNVKGIDYRTYIGGLLKALDRFCNAIGKLADKAPDHDSNERIITREKRIETVISYFEVSDTAREKDSNELQALSALVSSLQRRYTRHGSTGSGFYRNPEYVVRIKQSAHNDLYAYINAYRLLETPEQIISDMAKKYNAHILMISATASIKTPLCNFNLEWDEIKREITEINDADKREALDYYHERTKNYKDVQLNKDIVTEEISTVTPKMQLEETFSLWKEIAKKEGANNFSGLKTLLSMLSQECSEIDMMRKQKDENGLPYRGLQLLKLCAEMARKIQVGCRISLMITSFSACKYEDQIKLLLEEAELKEKYVLAFSNSKKLSDDTKALQKSIKEGKRGFLFVAAATVEQGIDIKFEVNANDKNLIPLNSQAAKRLDSARQNRGCVEIDFDGLYIGALRASGISLTQDEDSVSLITSLLEAVYKISSAYEMGLIGKESRNKILRKVLEFTKYPILSALDKHDHEENNERNRLIAPQVMRLVLQVAGRACRSDIKLSRMDVRLDCKLSNILSAYDGLNDYLSDFAIEAMHPIMNECMNALFTSVQVPGEQVKNVPAFTVQNLLEPMQRDDLNYIDHNQVMVTSSAVYVRNMSECMIRAIGPILEHKRRSSEDRKVFEAMTKTHLSPLIEGNLDETRDRRIAQLGSFSCTLNDREKCAWKRLYYDINRLSFPDSWKIENGYYAVIGNGKSRNITQGIEYVQAVYPSKPDISKPLRNVAPVYIPRFLRKDVERSSISLSWARGDYILSPYGFDLYKGVIGEAIGKIYEEALSAGLASPLEVQPLPDPCAEQMDGYQIRNDANGAYLLTVDYKFYTSEKSAQRHDSSQEYAALYTKKLEAISKEFPDLPILGIELNTGAGEDWNAVESVSPKDLSLDSGVPCKFVCVANIYDENRKAFDHATMLTLCELLERREI